MYTIKMEVLVIFFWSHSTLFEFSPVLLKKFKMTEYLYFCQKNDLHNYVLYKLIFFMIKKQLNLRTIIFFFSSKMEINQIYKILAKR